MNKQLSISAENVAKLGSDNNYEYAALINVNTLKQEYIGTSKQQDSINSYIPYLEENKNEHYYLVHNHNEAVGMSINDMDELAYHLNLDGIFMTSNDASLIQFIESNGNKISDISVASLYTKEVPFNYPEFDFTDDDLLDYASRIMPHFVKDFAKNGVMYEKRR